MTKKNKKFLIFLCVGLFCLVIYACRLNNYLIMELFFEAKYASAAIAMKNLSDIFQPALNGEVFTSAGPLYYLIVKFCSLFFVKYSEIPIRLGSGIVMLTAAFGVYRALTETVNEKFAVIASFTTFSSLIFVIFSSISSPFMISSCFIILSIIFGLSSVLIVSDKENYVYNILFWIFAAFAVLTTDITAAVLPFVTVFPLVIVFGKIKEFFKPIKFLSGLLVFLLFTFPILSKCMNVDYVVSNILAVKESLLSMNFITNYKFFLKYSVLYFIIGGMPWIFFYFLFFTAIPYLFFKKIKNRVIHKTEIINDNLAFILTSAIWGFFCAAVFYVISGVTDFSRLTVCLYFASLICAFFWYKQLCENKYLKVGYAASILLYVSLIIASVGGIMAYFFINPVQKTYIDPLLPPLILVTLLVAIPGMIAIILKRNVLNFSVHIFISIIMFFMSTGLLYNYVNSFGENDLVNIAIKARQDKVNLATYDIIERYAMTYYFSDKVEFNKMLTADEIYQKYGNTRKTYLVLKHNDLSYFDKFFVYEVVTTGKQYCGITNIKYLPVDEVKEDPEAQPDTVL